MTQNPVGWFEIYVQDMPRAKAFYEAVFRQPLQKEYSPESTFDMYSFPCLDGTGCGGALVRMEGCPSGGNSTIVYFSCADCAQESQRVLAAGGKIFREKFSIGHYGFIALAIDTEGNMFGLHSPI